MHKCKKTISNSNIKSIYHYIQKNSSKKCLAQCTLPPRKTSIIRLVYEAASGKYLSVTNTFISFICMGIGDYIQQNIEIHRNIIRKFDLERLQKMSVAGAILGAYAHKFYSILDTYIVGNSTQTLIKKVIIDLTINSTITIVLFFSLCGYIEGQAFKETLVEVKEKFFDIYKVDVCFWGPLQAINFYWVPPALRVTYVNILMIIYNVFLSWIKHRPQPEI